MQETKSQRDIRVLKANPARLARKRARDAERRKERYREDMEYRERERDRSRVRAAERRADPVLRQKDLELERLWRARRRAADPVYFNKVRKSRRPTEPYYPAAVIVACFDRYDGVSASDSDRRLLAKLRSGERDKLTINQADDFLLRCGLGLYYIEEEPCQ